MWCWCASVNSFNCCRAMNKCLSAICESSDYLWQKSHVSGRYRNARPILIWLNEHLLLLFVYWQPKVSRTLLNNFRGICTSSGNNIHITYSTTRHGIATIIHHYNHHYRHRLHHELSPAIFRRWFCICSNVQCYTHDLSPFVFIPIFSYIILYHTHLACNNYIYIIYTRLVAIHFCIIVWWVGIFAFSGGNSSAKTPRSLCI